MRIFVISLIILCCAISSANAQLTSTEADHLKKINTLQKDTGFKRFNAQLAAIMKSAKGRKTNFAAVKSLFNANKTALAGMKTRSDLGAGYSGNSEFEAVGDKLEFVKNMTLKNIKAITARTAVYNGPFTKSWFKFGNDMIAWNTTQSSQEHNWVSPESIGQYRYLGKTAFWESKQITVPNDPQIVAARIHFFYSFFSTGWETEGGSYAIRLMVKADTTFHSPFYDALPASSINSSPKWKNLINISERAFTSIEDFSINLDSYSVMEGYVRPGTDINFMMGISYGHTTVGNFGAYHYGEFHLKKIVVDYLKAGELP